MACREDGPDRTERLRTRVLNRRSIEKVIFSVRLGLLLAALCIGAAGQGKNPLIVIPGMTGSELRHKESGDKVWFKALKGKGEDLRLPVVADPTKTGDDLIATDVLRDVRVAVFSVIDVYGDFIEAMETRGGYREESWETPSQDGWKDSLYVFAYDWRLDNVENARLLVRKVESLKVKLNRPELRFDVVAHSMGGLISRYAAMYGDAELPRTKPHPTWAGSKLFDRIILLGTPNEGSSLALNALINGYSVGSLRVDLPFIQDSSKFLVFTIPAAYELLPAPGTLRVLDERLEPMHVDIYDPKVWSRYGWNVIDDKDFPSRFSVAERKVAPAYFSAALDRARRLHEALAAGDGKTGGVSFHVVGSDCKTAPDAIVIYRDGSGDRWNTVFKPNGFRRSDGTRITDEELKAIMLAPGDGTVTRRSLEGATDKRGAVNGTHPSKFFCESHNKLPGNPRIQDHIIGLLKDATAAVLEKDEEQ